jgi:hypothetical protein
MTPTPDHEALEKAYEDAVGAFRHNKLQDGRDEPAIRKAITAFLSSLDGYKLIAREPTEEMRKAWEAPGMEYIYQLIWDAAPDITKKERSDGSTYLALSH